MLSELYLRSNYQTALLTLLSYPGFASRAMAVPKKTNPDSWVAKFDEDSRFYEWDQSLHERFLGDVLKKYLLSDDASTAAGTARQIDNFYREIFLFSDYSMREADDKGIPVYLDSFYDIVLTFARLLAHNNSKQDMLLQVLLELRELPQIEFKLRNVRELSEHIPRFAVPY